MNVYFDEKYRNGNWSFPNTNIDPKKKEEPEYCKKWVEAIYAMHVQNKSGIPYDQLNAWENQRQYGRGEQGKDRYKSIVYTEDVTTDETFLGVDGIPRNTLEERRKGWKNVNDDIVSVAPKIKDVFHGMFDNQDFDINADTIDLNSGAMKDRMKYGLLTQTLFKKELERLRAIGGIPETPNEFLPQNVTELEMFEAAGGFKLQVAKTMEKLIKHTFDISDWDYTQKTKLLDDVLDIGYIALEEYYDEDTCKAKTRYVDPAELSIQYSKEEDYENPDWVGRYHTYTISQLEQKGFSREELSKIALDCSGMLGNPNKEVWPDFSKANTLGGYDYDFYKIPVYEGYWIDSNTHKYLKYQNAEGKNRMKEVPYDEDETKYTKKKVVKNNVRLVYTGKWIIGTEKMFDYGMLYDQLRPTPSKPLIPIRVVKVTDNPVMRRLKPVLDKMQLAWLRYQNALIMTAGGGWAVNVRLLSNITLGGKKLEFKDIFNIMRNQNMLFYSDTPIHGRYEGGAVNPVTPLPSMLKDEIANAIADFEYSIRMVETVTGLTPVALGGTPEERAGKGTTEMSFAATQNVMRPIISNIMVLKQRIAESAMLHIQMLIRGNEKAYEAYADVVGEMDIISLKSAIYEGTRYGIKLRPRPTEQEWAKIEELMTEAISIGRDGVVSLAIDDAIEVYQLRSSGANLDEIRMILSYKLKKYREQKQQEALQTQRFQQEGSMQQQNAKLQAEAQGKQFDAEIELKKLNQEHQNKLKEITLQGNLDIKRDVMKYAREEDAEKVEMSKPKTV